MSGVPMPAKARKHEHPASRGHRPEWAACGGKLAGTLKIVTGTPRSTRKSQKGRPRRSSSISPPGPSLEVER